MIWSTFKTEVMNRLEDTSLTSFMHGWFNDVQSEVDSKTTWRHLEKYKVLSTKAPYTTGTISISNGAAILTGSGTTFESGMVGQIFLGPDNNTYKILSYQSSTQLTLETNYIGTTASGKTYSIYYYKLSVPTDFNSPRLSSISIQNGRGPNQRLYAIDEDKLFDYAPGITWNAGLPSRYRFFSGDIILWPPANSVYNIDVYYSKQPDEMSENSDASVDLSLNWPTSIQWVILLGVTAKGLQYINDDQYMAVKQEYQQRLLDQMKKNNVLISQDTSMRRWDDGTRLMTLGPGTLPRNLG